MLRKCFAVLALLVLAACGGGTASAPFAPDSAVMAARYVHDGPPAVTLFTVVNNKTDKEDLEPRGLLELKVVSLKPGGETFE